MDQKIKIDWTDHTLDDQNRIVEEDEFPDDIPLG